MRMLVAKISKAREMCRLIETYKMVENKPEEMPAADPAALSDSFL